MEKDGLECSSKEIIVQTWKTCDDGGGEDGDERWGMGCVYRHHSAELGHQICSQLM